MGVNGLYSYLKNRFATTAAEAVNCKQRTQAQAQAHATNDRREHILLFDGNGLYHHLLYRYCSRSPRSLGGDWFAFYTACEWFFSTLRVNFDFTCYVIFDGIAGGRHDMKEMTREVRLKERIEKMKLFRATLQQTSTYTHLPSHCHALDDALERLLPVPFGSLMTFIQILEALQVPIWTSDGENDEHLAAIATQLRLGNRNGTPPPIVDIVAQDSDFIIFETVHRAAYEAGKDTGGYVPLDSLRFGNEEQEETTEVEESAEEDDDISRDSSAPPLPSPSASILSTLSFRRYTSTRILDALQLPACWMPTLACLIGNDSRIPLTKFHAYLRSPPFLRTLQLDHISYHPKSSSTKSLTSSSSLISLDVNGGFATSSQLVEGVLAFLHWCWKHTQRYEASIDHINRDGTKLTKLERNAKRQQLQAAYEAHTREVYQRIFGTPQPNQTLREHQLDGCTNDSTLLHLFRSAQMKYSLKRFFTPPAQRRCCCNSQQRQQEKEACCASRAYGIFEPGFEIDIVSPESESIHASGETDDADCSKPSSVTAEVSSASRTSSSILLPSPFLTLYANSHFSPQLLTVLLTRTFQSHLSIAHVLHPCVAHCLKPTRNGECWLATPASTSTSTQQKSNSDQHPSRCLSVDECSSGIRKRLYHLLFSLNLRPLLSIPSQSPASSFTTPSPPSLVVNEKIYVAPSSSDSIMMAKLEVEVTPKAPSFDLGRDDLQSILPSLQLPPLFTHPRSSSLQRDWFDFFAIVDATNDVIAPSHQLSLPSTSHSLKRISHLISAFRPLFDLSLTYVPIATIIRTTFLQSLRGVLEHAAPVEIASSASRSFSDDRQALLDRAVIGINAIIMQFAMTYYRYGMKTTSSTMQFPSPSPPPSSSPLPSVFTSSPSSIDSFAFSLDGVSFHQLFLDTYQLTLFTLQILRCRSSLEGNVTDESVPPLPLPPLFQTYTGTIFHRIYFTILSRLQSMRNMKDKPNTVKKSNTNNPQEKPTIHAPTIPTKKTPTRVSSSSPAPSSSSSSHSSSSIFSSSLTIALESLDDTIQSILMDEVALDHPDMSTLSCSQRSCVIKLFHDLKNGVFASLDLKTNPISANQSQSQPQSKQLSPSEEIDQSISALAIRDRIDKSATANVTRPILPYQIYSSHHDDNTLADDEDAASSSLTSPSITFSLCCHLNESSSSPSCELASFSSSSAPTSSPVSQCGAALIHFPICADSLDSDDELSPFVDVKVKKKAGKGKSKKSGRKK